jgi:energy-coupling factor transport system substrate-specific component
MVALIGALAALAALGRIVLAPIPSFKPTTDIVLLSGYALGGAPGLMVGVTAAFLANFALGHGPWTLWQMFAWGGIGCAGALLGRFTNHQLGRWSLVAACALSGVFFSLVANFSFWVTFSDAHRLETLIPYSISALPFDIAHIIGNIFFCLAFGPSLVAALRRHQARTTVIWRTP